MTAQKLSPEFEERFARINIDLAAKEGQSGLEPEISNNQKSMSSGGPRSGRKKTYPSHLYPNGTPSASSTTPSKQPVLSTAKRAKSRNLSNQLKNASKSTSDGQVLATPSRIGSQNINKHGNRSLSTVKQQPSKRILSCPMSERPHRTNDQQFSFMKETSSSINKHVNVFNNGVGTSPTPSQVPQEPQVHQKRIGSSNSTKRRHQLEHRTRNISGGSYNHGARDRRVMSTHVPSIKPTDITNISYNVPTLKFHEIKSKDEHLKVPNYNGLNYNTTYDAINSPSKTRHVSQPFTQKSKEDVYSRLYKNSNSGRSRSGITSLSSLLNSGHDYHQNRDQYSESESNNTEIRKIQNAHELILIIYQEDPDLFSVGYTSHKEFTKNEPMDTPKLVSGTSGCSGPLSIYERGEVLRKKDIYFMPNESGNNLENEPRSINVRNYSENFGFDDNSGNYIIVPHDHVNYRYEIESILGNGSFGNVVRCKDHKYFDLDNNSKTVAIKIIKNDINWSLQAVYETKMIKHLNEKMKTARSSLLERDFPILTYIDHFHFRGHMCIITEMLSLNLYSLLEIIKFRGLSFNLLRLFSRDILRGLDFIHKQNIIHCDIKPENIMIKLPSDFDPKNPINEKFFIVKIIDFGSSCFDKEISYSYIQSRFYRAPEVVLGANYNNMIDIWSFGCVIAELFSGAPLLPGKYELEQIGLILEIFGAPNSSLILDQRNKLMKSTKRQKAASNINNIIPDKGIDQLITNKIPVDEKTIRKTLLFSLFDILGKINLQFLNMRSNVVANETASTLPGSSAVKKKFKPNSKSLEILLRLNTSKENKKDTQLFSKFLHSIFKWNPSERPSASDLLNDSFLGEI